MNDNMNDKMCDSNTPVDTSELPYANLLLRMNEALGRISVLTSAFRVSQDSLEESTKEPRRELSDFESALTDSVSRAEIIANDLRL